MNCSIVEHFSTLNDPRIERKKLHQLMDIIVLSICATLSCNGLIKQDAS
ncbi:MAG: transposase family protein [Methylococcales bacterium]|nr:transposase family protein [Methylococcales bacterium]